MPINAQQPFIIKRSPIVIVKTIILIEVAALLLFLAARPLAFYKDLYNQYVYRSIIPYEYSLVAMFLVAFFEILLTVYAFLRWHVEAYYVDRQHLTHAWGLVIRRKTVTPLADIYSVSFHEGRLVGRYSDYGDITLHIRSADALKLKDIPRQKECAERIMQYKEGREDPPQQSEMPDMTLNEILSQTEHTHIEFKSTLRWDVRSQKINRDLEKAVLKSLAAFLNSHGGYVVVGVGDAGEVIGVAHDCRTLQRKDTDGFENHVTQIFCNSVGAEFRQLVTIGFHPYDAEHVCVMRALPSPKPVYVTHDGREEFYIRTGNTTRALTLREANAYISSRWGG